MKVVHVTLAANGRFPLFPTDEARRLAVWKTIAAGGSTLLLFCVVDDHVHLVLSGESRQIDYRARAVVQSLHPVAEGRFAPAHHAAVEERKHLLTLVSYVHEQPSHHKLAGAPHSALWEGSSFLDHVGARWIPGFDSSLLRSLLPRFGDDQLFASVGLKWMRPAPEEELRRLSPVQLVRLAEHAVAAPLTSNLPHLCEARAAVAQIGERAGYAHKLVATALDVAPSSIRRMLKRPVDPRWSTTFRMQCAIRRQLAPPAAMPLAAP